MTSRVASFHALALFIAIPVTLLSAQQKIPLPAGCGAGSTFDSCFHQHAVVAHENGISTKPLQGKLLEDYPVDGPIGISFDNNEATALTDQALITCPPASKCFAEIDVSIQLDDLQPEDPVYNTFAASRMAFTARDDQGKVALYIRPLDSVTAQALPGTDEAMYPFWSPDGREIGFFAQGKLKRISATGGPAQITCDASSGRGGAWNKDGVILFSASVSSGLFRVPAEWRHTGACLQARSREIRKQPPLALLPA